MTPSRDCTLCGSPHTRAIQTFQTAALVQRWREQYQIDVEPEFAGLSEFELRQCDRCLVRYFAPGSLCGSGNLYAALDRFDWYYIPEKWEHLQALADIRGCSSVLEIGCGFGDFIELARKSLGIQIQGLEQNPEAIEEARRRGIALDSSDLRDFVSASAGKYDAVCSFQVLEHVPFPGDFLRLCCELLTPKGRLILGLPNGDSFLRLQSNLLDLPPHHMTRWPLETIKSLPEYFPVRLVRLACEPLAELHVPGYVEAHCDRLARNLLPFANHPGVESRLIRFLNRTGFRKLLRGMTVYAAFEKH